jgi:hypothetical protein
MNFYVGTRPVAHDLTAAPPTLPLRRRDCRSEHLACTRCGRFLPLRLFAGLGHTGARVARVLLRRAQRRLQSTDGISVANDFATLPHQLLIDAGQLLPAQVPPPAIHPIVGAPPRPLLVQLLLDGTHASELRSSLHELRLLVGRSHGGLGALEFGLSRFKCGVCSPCVVLRHGDRRTSLDDGGVVPARARNAKHHQSEDPWDRSHGGRS